VTDVSGAGSDRGESAAAHTPPRGWIPCLACWLAEKFGKPYPKTHTGIGPRCPRWPYRLDWATTNSAQLAELLDELREAFEGYYAKGDLARLLNAEALLREVDRAPSH
jgi:hypothetical protein